MHIFLTKLAQVDSVRLVVFVSNRGEVLFSSGAAKSGGEADRWREMIAGLAGSPAAELALADGRYYLHDLGLGHLIVGLADPRRLAQVKAVCSQAQSKLADPAVRQKALKTLKEMTAGQPRPARVPGEGGEPGTAGLQLAELLALGKKEAIDRLLQAIETAARTGRFEQADKSRDWLMRVDPLALRQSIRAAEIIEKAKIASVDGKFRQTWHELATALEPEEFATLYHLMTRREFAKDEPVVRQGEFAASLLFINSGRLQLYALSADREVALKICAAGEIVGVENFFESSVWTVNARSLGAEISLLGRDKLQRHQEHYPALAGKLRDFCARFPATSALFSKTGRTRRRFQRQKAVGAAIVVVLDEEDRETGGGAKGEILDISRGGMSVALRFSQREKAEAMLGKTIRITMETGRVAAPLTCQATVVAVRCRDFLGNDYSLHAEFPRELDLALLQQVAGRGQAPRK